MTISTRHVEWAAVLFLFAIVALVFQQIATDMEAQGIAHGGPYDNAAAYPRMIAVVLGGLAAVQVVVQLVRRSAVGEAVPLVRLARPAGMVVVFAVYLGVLGSVGYHIATPLMLAALMVLCGIRRPVAVVVPAVLISLVLAYVFEAWLNIVLPGGMFALNIAW